MKSKWFLILFIGIFVLILVGFALSTTFLLVKNVCNSDIIIGAIGEGVSFLGTIVLGIVAYWQTKAANDISRAQLRREMVTSLVLQSNVTLKPVEIIPPKILNYAKDLQPEGIYCSCKQLSEFDTDQQVKFFGFLFQMDSIGAPLEKILINDVKINKLLAGKEYYVDLKILNTQKEVVFSYNPKKQCYVVGLYMDVDEFRYNKLIKDGLLIIDIDFDVVSSYGTILQHRFSINFEHKQDVMAKLINGKNSKQDVDLENVLMYKGEPRYDKR